MPVWIRTDIAKVVVGGNKHDLVPGVALIAEAQYPATEARVSTQIRFRLVLWWYGNTPANDAKRVAIGEIPVLTSTP